MERQSSFSRGVRPGSSSFAGAAVLERREQERPTTKTGNGAHRGDGAHAAVDQELFADYAGQVAAIRKSQAVIEFAMDGTILDANDNFLKALGYRLEEIQGQHHSMFVEPAYKQSNEYHEFWAALNRGEYQAAEYKRIGKGGKEVWIQASYNPILDPNGKPFKVVKFATDMTEQKLRNADYIGQIAAVNKSQAVIEFKMDGTVLTANDNFLRALDYTLDEIKGRHHSMFVDEAYRQSYEYKEFWAALNRGEYQAAEYKRLGKGGKEVWIQASYNPIMDLNGKPFKVVKYATDITPQKQALNAMLADAALLTKAAIEGKLATRADASKHHGEFRKVVEGVNATLDAVIGPLNVSAEYVDRISKGDIPPKITDTYNGDFNEIKNNLNNCIDNIKALVTETGGLIKASADGQLSTRADASKHQGEYRRIVEGVNQMLDEILLPIGEGNRVLSLIRGGNLREKVEIVCKGDHAKMKDSINGVHAWLTELIAFVTKVANGDMSAAMAKASDLDQIHEWLVLLKTNISKLIEDTDELAKAAAEGKLGKRADAGKHKGDYRKIVEGINKTLEMVVEPLKVTAQNASTLASSSEELTAVSQQMAGNAEETATQANVVSAASEEVSKNVASVASASEEMQASIREIAKNANESARVAKNAVNVAHSTNETVKKLGESSQEIGNVIKVITSIAQQTNLLALNATIEAARAGEAGKGFAVVANEVKELAKQTAKATEDIGQKIEAIQGDTKGAVTAIEEISNIINQVNDISNSIASAVEEQTVTTNEIGHSVTEAAKGVGDIAKNIGGVALAAKNTTQGANDTQKASAELSHMAAQLQKVVSRFTF
jgi:methyl-accepting chemotaxis protein